MLRAAAACEAAGIPTSSLVCEGFLQQAKAVSFGLGMDLPVATVPGHIAVQSAQTLQENVSGTTLFQLVANLTRADAPTADESNDPGPRDIVFTGGFDALNEYFYDREWSDGLPVVPPTLEKIEAFLEHTNLGADEIIGTLLPDKRLATIWSIAVNGVMAGCRPESMPLLIAMIEALADPAYGVEHSGATPGGETLIVVSGAIVKRLGLNYTQGVMRDGFRANTSIGRFWRLYLRNVAGFRLHKNDKATYGNTWRVVVAENADCLRALDWPSFGEDMGFAKDVDTVSIANYTGGNVLANVSGDPHRHMLPYIADAVKRQISWQLYFSVAAGLGKVRPLILISPLLAQTFAGQGITKESIRRYLFEEARISAREFEQIQKEWCQLVPDCDLVALARSGTIPAVFGKSDDPERKVPLVWKPEDYSILVTGDPLRNNAYVFAPSGLRGYSVTKAISK